MFRKLIQSSIKLQPKNVRSAQLQQYLTLRSQLSDSTSTKSQQLSSLQKKYQLNDQDIQSMVKILLLSKDNLENNFSYDSMAQEIEETSSVYRYSKFYAGQDIQTASEQLRKQYPEVLDYLRADSAQAEILKELEAIFVSEGPITSSLSNQDYGLLYLEQFQNKISQLCQQLNSKNSNPNDKQKLYQINKTMESWVQNYKNNPGVVYGQTLSFLDFHRNLQGQTKLNAPVNNQTSLEESNYLAEYQQSIENEMEMLMAEEKQEIVEPFKTCFLPWVNNKKPVFSYTFQQQVTIQYALATAGLSLAFLYFGYLGDATYKTLITLPSLALASGLVYQRKQMQNEFRYLVEIILHKDGKTIDAVVQNHVDKLRVDNIPISEIKQVSGNHVIQYQGKGIQVNEIRNLGLPGDCQIYDIAGITTLVPINYEGNRLVTDSILEGKNVDTSDL